MEAMRLGAFYYLTKPFKQTDLLIADQNAHWKKTPAHQGPAFAAREVGPLPL